MNNDKTEKKVILKLTRLVDFQIKGNFTIKCHTQEMYGDVLSFFYNPDAVQALKFKDLFGVKEFQEQLKKDNKESLEKTGFPCISKAYIVWCIPEKWKFIIKYENLNELLKLREIFNVKASSFDTRLIQKRNYNPFTADFFDKIKLPVEKIKK